jgi:hypothetical protein
MKTATVRSLLALLFVGVFVAITGFMAIFPLVSTVKIGLNEYADFFAKTASVYTGIVGVIVGYYFGRATDEAKHLRSSSQSPELPGA